MALFSVYDMNESCQKIIFIAITNLSYLKLANVPLQAKGRMGEICAKNFEIYVTFLLFKVDTLISLVQFLNLRYT